MTTREASIDHAAEARSTLEEIGFPESNEGCIAVAQVHAILALVEAQREANEIARIQVMLQLPGSPEELREQAVQAGSPGVERMERILEGLGL